MNIYPCHISNHLPSAQGHPHQKPKRQNAWQQTNYVEYAKSSRSLSRDCEFDSGPSFHITVDSYPFFDSVHLLPKQSNTQKKKKITRITMHIKYIKRSRKRCCSFLFRLANTARARHNLSRCADFINSIRYVWVSSLKFTAHRGRNINIFFSSLPAVSLFELLLPAACLRCTFCFARWAKISAAEASTRTQQFSNRLINYNTVHLISESNGIFGGEYGRICRSKTKIINRQRQIGACLKCRHAQMCNSEVIETVCLSECLITRAMICF